MYRALFFLVTAFTQASVPLSGTYSDSAEMNLSVFHSVRLGMTAPEVRSNMRSEEKYTVVVSSGDHFCFKKLFFVTPHAIMTFTFQDNILVEKLYMSKH